MKKTFERGFTLIELLVVIAIIGILAAVVLASLSDARSGGQNASIQQTMSSFRSAAEVYYNNDGGFSYTDLCLDPVATTTINAALNVINGDADTFSGARATNDPANESNRLGQCVSDASRYQVTVPLAGGDWDQYWCIDSNGVATQLDETTKPAIDAVSCN